jgi:hypothetical protein
MGGGGTGGRARELTDQWRGTVEIHKGVSIDSGEGGGGGWGRSCGKTKQRQQRVVFDKILKQSCSQAIVWSTDSHALHRRDRENQRKVRGTVGKKRERSGTDITHGNLIELFHRASWSRAMILRLISSSD